MKPRNWGPWELVSVTMVRPDLDDESRVEVSECPTTLAMPPLRQCMHSEIRGGKVFVVCMGIEVEVADIKAARDLMDLFQLQYQLGTLAKPVSEFVQQENARPPVAHNTPPPESAATPPPRQTP